MFRPPPAAHGGNEQTFRQYGQIEAPITSVRERRQISGRILGERKGMVGPTETFFQIAMYGIDPLKFWDILGLAVVNDSGWVSAACSGGPVEAGQTVGVHGAVRCQGRSRPVHQGAEGEARNRCQLHPPQQILVLGQRHRGHERDFSWSIRGLPCHHCVPNELRIIDVDLPAQDVTLFALGHSGNQLVVDSPGGRIAAPKLAYQDQRREPVLGSTNPVDGKKPRRQGQPRRFHYGTGDQRRMMVAGFALEPLGPFSSNHAVHFATTARTGKFVELERLLKRGLALRPGTTLRDELGYRQPWLKLDSILAHGVPRRSVCRSSLRPVVAHRMSLRRVSANQQKQSNTI